MHKIVFDRRWLGKHGIGRFASEILSRINFSNSLNIRCKPTGIFDVFFLTFYMLIRRNTIVFSPGYNVPLLFLNRYIFFVHDLNHIDIDSNSSLLKRAYYNFLIKRACRKALLIFTISNFTKNRICDWAGVSVSKVINISAGVSPEFCLTVNPAKFDFKYFLCVSNRKLHKNEFRLVEAFSKIKLRYDMKLIFTGHSNIELKNHISRFNLEDSILFVGDVTDNDLASLYKGAESLVFISLYEGFGLPVVEAMRCGTAVIASNIPPIAEISNDSALLVNPFSISDIECAMERMLIDHKFRHELILKGLENSSNFKWENVANKIRLCLHDKGSSDDAGDCS